MEAHGFGLMRAQEDACVKGCLMLQVVSKQDECFQRQHQFAHLIVLWTRASAGGLTGRCPG